MHQEITNRREEPLTLLLDCKTRWNSTYLMLRRAYKLKAAIRLFITQTSDVSSLLLEEFEWRHVEYLLLLLYDFWLYTNCLSEHTGATVHQVFIIYDAIFNSIDDSISHLRNKKRAWKQSIYRGLVAAKQKLSNYYTQTYRFHGIIYAVAAILDPCQKLTTFQSGSWVDDKDVIWANEYLHALKKVFNYYQERYPDITEESLEPTHLSGLEKAFHRRTKRRRVSENQSTSTQTQYAEIRRYHGDYHSGAGTALNP